MINKLLTYILILHTMAVMASSAADATAEVGDATSRVAVRIDPRTFSGIRPFGFQANLAQEGNLGCLGVRNRDGTLEVFNIEIGETLFRTIFERNAEGAALTHSIQTDEWFRRSSLKEIDGSPWYYGQNIRTEGDDLQIASSQGVDLCRTVFIGATPLVFKTLGKKPSPLFAMVVEPFAPHERQGTIFEERGGALIDGVIDFNEPFGNDYLRGKSFNDSGVGPYFVAAAKSLNIIMMVTA